MAGSWSSGRVEVGGTASQVGDDPLVERVIDLDKAAAVIAERARRWIAAGLTVGQVTWRDEAARWPQPLETDRSLVRDPDSVGVLIAGAEDSELSVVLFRGGWADVDFIANLDDAGMLPASGIDSTEVFGTQLDQWVPCALGTSTGSRAGSVGCRLTWLPRDA